MANDDPLTDLDAAILDRLRAADGRLPPGSVAVGVGAPLDTAYDRLAHLADEGLVRRVGWATCELTDRGRRRLGDGAAV